MIRQSFGFWGASHYGCWSGVFDKLLLDLKRNERTTMIMMMIDDDDDDERTTMMTMMMMMMMMMMMNYTIMNVKIKTCGRRKKDANRDCLLSVLF